MSADDQMDAAPAVQQQDASGNDVPRVVAQGAEEFETALYYELGYLQDRLADAMKASRQAFVDMCYTSGRARGDDENVLFRKCESDAEQVMLHMKLVLEKHTRLTAVEPDMDNYYYAAAQWWQRPTAEMQPFVDAIAALLSRELAEFQQHINARRTQFAQHLFDLCSASGNARTRAEVLRQTAACQQQVRLLETQMDRIARVIFTGGDRRPFVHVEERYPLKLYTNVYPRNTDNSHPLPFLAALISEDKELSAAACVPLGLGPYWPQKRGLRAFARGKPRLVEQEAGNLKFFQLPENDYNQRLETEHPHFAEHVAQDPENSIRDYLFIEQDNISADILNCASHRFILLLLSGLRHQNALLIDTLARTVERIEPNGHARQSWDKYDHFEAAANLFVDKTLNQLGLGRFTYLPPATSCPHFGPQARQQSSQHGGGYCVAWSTFLLLSRILNPEYTTREVQEHIVLGRSPKYLKDLIRAFIAFMESKRQRGEFELPHEVVSDTEKLMQYNRSASPDAPFREY